MQIVLLDGYAVNPGDLDFGAFQALGQLTAYDRTPPELLAPRIQSAEAVLTHHTALGKELLIRAPRLRYVGILGHDATLIDLETAQSRGITVTSVDDAGQNARAEMSLALLLEISRNVGLHDRSVHAGRWTNAPDYRYWEAPQATLTGKTLGVVGTGQGGCRMASVCLALGMEVLGAGEEKKPRFPGRRVPMETLLSQSDVISIHCDEAHERRGMIDREALSRMKKGAVLINTAGGTLISEPDVAEALSTRQLYAYGADRAACEPLSALNPLLRARNCYLTPHLGDAPVEIRRRILEMAADKLKAFLAKESASAGNAGKDAL